MLNDVSFGQYYPTKSFVHNMDSRMKIILLIAYIVAIFLAKNFYGLLACAMVVLLAIIMSRVSIIAVLRSLKGIIFLVLLTAVISVFFNTSDSHIIWQWWILKVTRQGLISSAYLVSRIILLVMGSSLLTLTTTPVNLTDGIESLLYPLKFIKFPLREFALIMSIALSMIPTLMGETDRIMRAQKARGADFESGGLIKRAKAVIPILIPLLIGAFRRADELGDAMDARCYSESKNRTKYKKLKFTWRDFLGLILYAGLIVGIVYLNMYMGSVL